MAELPMTQLVGQHGKDFLCITSLAVLLERIRNKFDQVIRWSLESIDEKFFSSPSFLVVRLAVPEASVLGPLAQLACNPRSRCRTRQYA